jgi:PilZ domain
MFAFWESTPSWRRFSQRWTLTNTERRNRKRYALRLPLSVRPTEVLAAEEILTECTNVSSRGVYFFLQQPAGIDPGSRLELMLTLPSEITRGEPVRVRCEARVQRKETAEKGRVGIAAKIERYRFLPGKRRRAG